MALFQLKQSLNELTEVKEGIEIRTRIQESLLLFWYDCFSFEDDELPQSSDGFLLCVFLFCFVFSRGGSLFVNPSPSWGLQ